MVFQIIINDGEYIQEVITVHGKLSKEQKHGSFNTDYDTTFSAMRGHEFEIRNHTYISAGDIFDILRDGLRVKDGDQ